MYECSNNIILRLYVSLIQSFGVPNNAVDTGITRGNTKYGNNHAVMCMTTHQSIVKTTKVLIMVVYEEAHAIVQKSS